MNKEPKTKRELAFNSHGNQMYLSMNDKPIEKYKLAFSWQVASIYNGSRLLYLLKRFFTTLRIRSYPTSN